MAISRQDVLRYLSGHRRAEARLRRETWRRLAALTVAEARAEYASLWQAWQASRAGGDQAALDRRAIQDRVALRRRLAARRERPV